MVIGIGFHKTGTTSLSHALGILGYNPKDITPRALIPILKGDFKKVIRIIKDHDALFDHPWFMIYKELDERIPGTKFILTIREEESWYKSISRHMEDDRKAQLEWIYGRGKGLPKNNKDHFITTYRKHNQNVLAYFKDRPADLLVLNLSEGNEWEKICTFLGKEIPNEAFPKSNTSSDNQRTNFSLRMKIRFLRRRVKNYIHIKYIDWRGYW